MKYNEVVQYRGESLFSGALDSDCILNQIEKAVQVARSYIFHGKNYHVGSSAMESSPLIDSVSFTKEILNALSGRSKDNMMLAIAGYGAGKTHFAIALSVLLSTRNDAVRNDILSSIAKVDSSAASEIRGMLEEIEKPFLVVPVNGILSNSSLRDMIFKSLRIVIARDHQRSKAMESFDSKYGYLKQTLSIHSDKTLVNSILRDSALSMEEFGKAMDAFDSEVFERVKQACIKNGLAIYETASSGELKDLIIAVSNELCGPEKPYRAMLLLFDEFGKYMSFAAANESIAGSGIMQQLFDGIQGSASEREKKVVLLGFSQLDLKQYQSSIGDSLVSSNLNRYVTRFDSAKRYHLSVSFESLIANLLYKQPERFLLDMDDYRLSMQVPELIKSLNKYFPVSLNYPVWSKQSLFASVICKGCWPLSPYLTWTLAYISSKNDILQQRSGLNLLGSIIAKYESKDADVYAIGNIPAVSLFDVGLLDELVASEKDFLRSDPIATEYNNIIQKYGVNLTDNEIRILQSIVLSHKLGANIATEVQSRELICKLSNLEMRTVGIGIKKCVTDYNFISFNQITKLYDIQSDSVSYAEFNNDIVKQCAEFYSSHDRKALFANLKSVLRYTEMNAIRDEFFSDLDTDFGMEKDIRTEEWGYAHFDFFGYDYAQEIGGIIALDKLDSCTAFNQKKGKLFIVVLPKDVPFETAHTEIKKWFSLANDHAGFVRPYMALVYHDVGDRLLNLAIRYNVLACLTKEKAERYSSLVGTDKSKTLEEIRQTLEEYRNKKYYVYPIESSSRLKVTGEMIFELTYPKAISFPVDGFGINSKNGPESIRILYSLLVEGQFNYHAFTSLDTMHGNRANAVLKDGWKCFERNGCLKRLPGNDQISEYFSILDNQLTEAGQIDFYGIYNTLLMPPYGANSTQATLIAFLYLGARLESVNLFDEHGNPIDDKNERVRSKRNFEAKTKALTAKDWNGIMIKPAISDDAKWYSLIERWNACRKLVDLQTCGKEADTLIESHITIPQILRGPFEGLVTKTQNATKAFDEWMEAWTGFSSVIDDLVSINDIREIASEITKLITAHDSSFTKGKVPLENSLETEYENQVTAAREIIAKGIEKWISSHPLSLDLTDEQKESQIKGFQDFMNDLKVLNCIEENNLLKEVFEEYKRKDEKRNKAYELIIAYTIEVDRIERNISQIITEQIAKDDIKEIDKEIKGLAAIDREILGDYAADYELLTMRCNEAKEILSTTLKENEEAYSALINYKIETFEDCEEVKRGLEKAYLFYQGEESKKLNKIKACRKEIELLEKAYMQLNRSNSTIEELEEELCSLKESIEEKMDGDSGFDDEEILDRFFNEIVASRAEMSRRWIAEKEREWSTREPSQIERLSVLLKEPPLYISADDLARCKELLSEIEEVKRANRINNLVSLFNSLSPSEKELFLGKIRH